MSRTKKIVIGIVVLAIAVCLGIFAYISNKESSIPVVINLDELNKKLAVDTTYTSTRMEDITKDNIYDIFGINKEDVEQVIGKMPTVNIKASMYVVVKANAGKTKYIKDKFEEYAVKYEEQWSKYLEGEYQLVKDRKIAIKGDYVYLLIGNNVKDIEDEIK